MKSFLLSISLFSVAAVAMADTRTIVIHPPYVAATCPRTVDSGFHVSPRLDAVEAMVDGPSLLMSFKTVLSTCEYHDGVFQWKRVENPYDYEVQYLSGSGEWLYRREVIDSRINPMNRVELIAGLANRSSSRMADHVKSKMQKSREGKLSANVKFEVSQILSSADLSTLAEGKPVVVRFEANHLINATMLFDGRLTDASQMGDIPYYANAIDVILSKDSGNGIMVKEVRFKK